MESVRLSKLYLSERRRVVFLTSLSSAHVQNHGTTEGTMLPKMHRYAEEEMS